VSGGGIPDDALLAAIRAMYDRLDPPPPDLTERVRFALSLENLEVELLRMEQELLAGAGARGEERARTVTFSSQSLAVMVTLAEDAGGTRIDGWIAGGGGLRVELRRPGSARRAHADEEGRFVFEAVAAGIVQLVFTPMPGAALDLQVPVVTPAIEI
jgi:hypothetical protein